jgi:hypothetical protein
MTIKGVSIVVWGASSSVTATPVVEPPPTPAEVRRIAAIHNPVIRNLEITHAYARLAAAMGRRLGGGANWCCFATWASRQAGRTIRGEDLIGYVRYRLGRRAGILNPIAAFGRWLLRRGLFHPETLIGRITDRLHTPFDAFERASAAVARGNLKVFAEIGFEFARYLDECPPDVGPDSSTFETFLEGLRPGEPPEGQGLLRQAFTRYQRHGLERDPKRRCELALLANLEIGLHEQTRLQPEIREALDAPYETREDLSRRASGMAPRPVRGRLRLLFRKLTAPAQRHMSTVAREAITDGFMVLALPGRVLALGSHLDAPFPEPLRELAAEDLTGMLARFACGPADVDNCGAHDWSVLEQRMHYIVHLFRSYHAAEELYHSPFTHHQVEQFKNGLVPLGDL